jgi:tRNA nucleotidyltransferase (CCA-adding enzyme)
LRVAALFHGMANPGDKKAHEMESAKIAEKVLRRLRFSERMILRVTHLVKHHEDDKAYSLVWDERMLRRFVRGLGAEHLEAFFCLRRAELEAQGKDLRPLYGLEERAGAQVKAGFPHKVQDIKVDGRKVMEVLNIPEGPEVGRILEALLEEVLDHPEWNTKEKLIERLKKTSEERERDR